MKQPETIDKMTRPRRSLASKPEPLPVDLVAHRGVVEGIYDALHEAITSGRIAPGHRLREIPVSRQFNVSTTPVREALRRLGADGLVDVLPRRGAVVVDLAPDEVDDLYEVRLLLEAGAVRRATRRPVKDFRRIETLMGRMREVIDAPDQVEFNRLDVELHRAISELSGNTHLAEFAQRTHRRIQAVRIRCAVYLPGRPAVSHREHEQIIEAVRAGDADGAEAAIVAHISSVREAVVAAIRRT